MSTQLHKFITRQLEFLCVISRQKLEFLKNPVPAHRVFSAHISSAIANFSGLK